MLNSEMKQTVVSLPIDWLGFSLSLGFCLPLSLSSELDELESPSSSNTLDEKLSLYSLIFLCNVSIFCGESS